MGYFRFCSAKGKERMLITGSGNLMFMFKPNVLVCGFTISVITKCTEESFASKHGHSKSTNNGRKANASKMNQQIALSMHCSAWQEPLHNRL